MHGIPSKGTVQLVAGAEERWRDLTASECAIELAAAKDTATRGIEVYCIRRYSLFGIPRVALKHGQQEGSGLMEQTGVVTQSETARAERLGLARAQQAWVRTLAEHHTALARELHALDEQVRALGILKQTLAMSRAEWLAQLAPLVRAEGEVLAQAHADRQLLHCLLLSAHCRQAPEE